MYLVIRLIFDKEITGIKIFDIMTWVMCLVVFIQPYASIKGNKKVIPNAERRNWKKKQ
jgi:hypothetical protein